MTDFGPGSAGALPRQEGDQGKLPHPADLSDLLPSPPVPSDSDLSSFVKMSWNVVRRRNSDIANVKDPEGFRGATLLADAAWHQRPAGSLPTEDHQLARLAGYGRDLRRWRRAVNAGALMGWYKCSDGRLYHDDVAEEVVIALASKRAGRNRTDNARKTVQENRQKREQDQADAPPTPSRHSGDTPVKFGDVDRASQEYQQDVDHEEYIQRFDIVEATLPVTDGLRKGDERKGEERKLKTPDATHQGSSAVPSDPPGFAVWWQAYPKKDAKGAARKAYSNALKRGTTPEGLLQAVRVYPFDLRDGGKFVPFPTTWLNQDRWESAAEAADSRKHVDLTGNHAPPRREGRADWLARDQGFLPSNPDGCSTLDGNDPTLFRKVP